MANLSSIGIAIFSVVLVVPFAPRFKPDKWYAHGLSVLVLAFLASSLAAFAIRSFLFQPFSIPASSMVPTLEVGDYLFASKFAYGYSRYSVPFGLLPIEGRTFDTAPALGDIAVFRRPSDPSTDYIKRIVGLPGDKIQMIDGVLHINDQAVKLEETGSYSSDEIRSAKVQRETLQNGVSYSVLDVIDGSTGDNTQPVVVPAGRYFMLGDNRDSSADSRFDMGTIPDENLVGRGVRLFWNSRGVDYSSRHTLDGLTGK
ncbi:MAG: signal peptidase I [Mesorhizobium sp.]|nr:signal peptidase I [Mesorhizobium sp. M5C.F.Cr.IN.023.01.1.1]RWF87107.1 MAG: signal peptidase I [Mesorhizobium sp.]RWF96354.1 MAG: signal peptidase I [Mesorhizobium sp.]RWI38681.1 MAG: signal peptidase I [Mesorhizobium sp.]RWI49796.1 MAG: signal peptidase I [Mesorhizobium sp.]